MRCFAITCALKTARKARDSDRTSPEAAALLGQFPAERERALFIVDPLGNLMMRHDAGVTTKDLLSDLKKLLKLSHIG